MGKDYLFGAKEVGDIKKYTAAMVIFAIFEAIAVVLWLTLDNIFYLFNFSYIGICLSAGLVLFAKKLKYARNAVQFAVGLYMLVFLGIINNENMQIEGLWYYLFLGVFEAAVIHYVVAKIFGPLVFGRGWCGYACWTAMILDLLPYKQPVPRKKKFGYVKYIVFAFSLTFVSSLFISRVQNLETIMLWSFIIGNVVYYIVGIILAYTCRDNRAFCKYVCPITVFLKPMSYFSVIRVKNDTSKCISCNKCKKVCPMEVDMVSNSRKRKNATECILCSKCVEACPTKSLHL